MPVITREVFKILKEIADRYQAAKKRKRVIFVIMPVIAALGCVISLCVPEERVPVLVCTGVFILWSFILLKSQKKQMDKCLNDMNEARKKYIDKKPDAEEAPDKKEK